MVRMDKCRERWNDQGGFVRFHNIIIYSRFYKPV